MLRADCFKLKYSRLLFAGGCILVTQILGSCANTPMSNAVLNQPPQALTQSVELTDVPFFPQQAYQCGPAALATVLVDTGIDVTPKELAPKVYLPERKGTLQTELLAATRRYGRLPFLLEPSLEMLLTQIKAGKPVLVLQNLGVQWIPSWHYAVVIGYDLQKQALLLRSGKTDRYHVNMHVFERTWQRSGYWAFVALKPGEVPATGQMLDYFNAVADFEKNRSPGEVITAYLAGLSRWPDSSVLGMGLGNIYYQTGVLDKAAESYTQILSRHPDYAPAHNNLAQVMMDQGKLEKAKKHAEIAVSLGGRHQQQYQLTLDEILSRMPNHEKRR